MKHATILISLLFALGCGGGGSSSSCDILKVSGGDSCSEGSSSVAFLRTSTGECTGTYISLTSVLTAAHCLVGASEAEVSTKGTIRTATQAFIHPSYNGQIGSIFDVAIVKVPSSPNVTPTPLLISRHPSVGEEVIAYGYGLDENGQEAASRIQEGKIPLKSASLLYEGLLDGLEVVSSNNGGFVCPGDSGGPVVAKADDGSYGIFGITSFGPQGCSAEQGRPAALAGTQMNGILDFITAVAPDFARN